MTELQPEDIYLTRAWLLKHGWEPTKNIPMFQHDPDCIDADLCVIVDRKDYMIAKFHYMGDDAWKPDAKPDSFELVGVNNSCDMLEYDHTRLVMAAFVCHLTGFEQIDNALGGKEWLQFRLPIHGIERSMTLMTIPSVMPDWGLITSEETIGDEITIRMYPDEVNEPVNVED